MGRGAGVSGLAGSGPCGFERGLGRGGGGAAEYLLTYSFTVC